MGARHHAVVDGRMLRSASKHSRATKPHQDRSHSHRRNRLFPPVHGPRHRAQHKRQRRRVTAQSRPRMSGEVQNLLRPDQRWLVGHPRHLDGGVRIEVVAVVVAPLVEADEAAHHHQRKQHQPQGVQRPAARRGGGQPQQDQPAKRPRQHIKLRNGLRVDGLHPDVMVQAVDAREVSLFLTLDSVYPNHQADAFGVLRGVERDAPQR